jgi:hypothetical protein
MCYLVILDVLGLFLNDYIGYIFIWHVGYLATYSIWPMGYLAICYVAYGLFGILKV